MTNLQMKMEASGIFSRGKAGPWPLPQGEGGVHVKSGEVGVHVKIQMGMLIQFFGFQIQGGVENWLYFFSLPKATDTVLSNFSPAITM